MKRPKLRIIELEDFQFRGSESIFNKFFLEENFPNLKKEMPINIQEAYRTSNRWDQKIKSLCHIIIKTLNLIF